ncbi:MAG: CPBP family intramembrane metalloprotease [Proteobacteria bacterium]|nr:CPBP family intramembrane metalloprotease [Pseudomonadota bacterium]
MTPRAWRFVGLSYVGSILIALPFAATGAPFSGLPGLVAGIALMFAPLVSMLIVCHRDGTPMMADLPLMPRSWPWMLFALLFPIGLNVIVAYASTLWPHVALAQGWEGAAAMAEGLVPPEELATQLAEVEAIGLPPVLLTALSAASAGLTINGLVAFGEEAGWRGLLHRELASLGFWRQSFITGVVWGFWHAPILLLGYNYPQHPVLGVFLFPVILALLSPWMTLARNRTDSVLSAAIFHGAFNGSAGMTFLVAIGGDDVTVGITSVTAIAVLTILNLALLAGLRWRPSLADPVSVATKAAAEG